MKTKLLSIFTMLTLCLEISAQQSVGTTFTSGGITYEITLAGTANANSRKEVAVKDYLDLNNLTPTIPATTFYGTTYHVTSIGFGAFANNSLTSVNIPTSITSIGAGAFENNSLASVVIPSSVTFIGDNAFAINSLTSITIPSAVTHIGTLAFAYNSALTEVISESTSPAILSNSTFDDNSIIDLTVPTGLEQTYINSNWFGFKTVNSIDYTFTQNDIVYQIVDITNNDKVAIYDYLGASTAISILATVTNSGSNYDVTTVGDFAFSNHSLTSLIIPSSITSIGKEAFSRNSLTSVIIPAFVNSIGEYAFNNNYNLTEVISESTNPATLISYTFFNNNIGVDLTIPANTTAAYTAARWVNFKSVTEVCNINIPDTNFKTALVADATINTNGDTEISCAEATAFTGTINVFNKGIFDLTGIESFINITGLNCANNSLNSLDVSANTALITLGCGFNKLTSLDVSTNLALGTLTCMNNRISSLDVSANSSLVDLICHTNYLSSLNVANGNNTAFTSFNATSNASLSCIEVDDVAYSTTNWTSIDAQTIFSTNCATAAVDNFTLNKVSIYPNPTTSVLNIKMDSNLKRATIYSVLGVKVLETSLKKIKISNLKNGLYLVKIEDKNGNILTKKIMKK